MSMYDQDIRLMAEELADEESIYTTCPACGRDGKFSVAIRDGLVLYNCFRPSCVLYGGGSIVSSGGRSLVHARSAPRKRKITPWDGDVAPLDDDWVLFLSQSLGLHREHLDLGRVYFAPEEHRVAYPILGPLGRRRGWCLRSYNGAQPKTLTRMDEDENSISFYRTDPARPVIVLVEDIPSALRVARYTNACALLGTGCNQQCAEEIAAFHCDVWWALDADATRAAISQARRYRLLFESSRVMTLDKDFKNMTEEEVVNKLGEYGVI